MNLRYRIISRNKNDGSEHVVFSGLTAKDVETTMKLLLRWRDHNDQLQYVTEEYLDMAAVSVVAATTAADGRKKA